MPDGRPEQLQFLWAQETPSEAPVSSAPPPAAPAPRTPGGREQAEALLDELTQRTGLTLHLRIHNNSSTMMSLRPAPNGASPRLGLHHMFLTASEDVIDALAHWVKHPAPKPSGGILDRFIRERRHQIRPRPPKKPRLRTQGQRHDLASVFEDINQRHFSGAVEAHITWGRWPSRKRRRSIRFGSYQPEQRLIRIHPALDRDFVPRYFIRYIVYHEMLHAHLGIGETDSGRRRIHPPSFKRVEEAYPDYAKAIAWMDNPKNLRRLLRGKI